VDTLARMHPVVRNPPKGMFLVLPRRVAHNAREDKMTIKIIPNDKGNPQGKLADVELHLRPRWLDESRHLRSRQYLEWIPNLREPAPRASEILRGEGLDGLR